MCTDSCRVSLGCYTNICTAEEDFDVWEEHSGNPVMSQGTSLAWNDAAVSSPTILRGGTTSGSAMASAGPSANGSTTTYQMWFTGWDSAAINRIGYATSPDGIHWAQHSGNPVLSEGAAGAWDAYGAYNPTVIRDGSTYKIWYHGHDGSQSRIGYATSPDGINWTKRPTAVLDLGPSGAWDTIGVGAPTVIKDGATYKMWYEGYDGWWWRIGYATSTDGINWTKHSGNPVIKEGPSGSWNEGHNGGPSVVKVGSAYHMLFAGNDADGTPRIAYATSTDGVSWTVSANNPQMTGGLANPWATEGVAHPTLLWDPNEGIFKAFYRGKSGSDWGIGYATTPSPAATGARTFGPWAAFAMGGSTLSGPGLAIYNGQPNVVVRGMDNGIYRSSRSSGGSWTAWADLHGLTDMGPGAAEFSGELWVFVRGLDGGIYSNRLAGQIGSGWSAVPGSTPSAPAAVVFGSELFLFVRGGDDGIYVNRFGGLAWSGWTAVGGSTPSGPAAVVFGGELHLLVRGADNGIYLNRFNGTAWSGWTAVGGSTPSGPAAAVFEATLYLFVQGGDNGIYDNRLGASWAGWRAVGGQTPSKPGAAATASTLYLAVRGADSGVYLNQLP